MEYFILSNPLRVPNLVEINLCLQMCVLWHFVLCWCMTLAREGATNTTPHRNVTVQYISPLPHYHHHRLSTLDICTTGLVMEQPGHRSRIVLHFMDVMRAPRSQVLCALCAHCVRELTRAGLYLNTQLTKMPPNK